MDRKEISNLLKRVKPELRQIYHVESLSLFGSYSRGDTTDKSDVDILVRYLKTPGLFQYMELKNYLEKILGKRVDLVTENALKKQMKEEILRELICVT